MSEARLFVDNVSINYRTRGGSVAAVSGASITLGHGETLAIVGESGSGKSTLVNAISGLLPHNARVAGGSIELFGEPTKTWSLRKWRSVRGARLGFVPQDPFVSLNPVMRIGNQIAEVFQLHTKLSREETRGRVLALLDQAGLDEPEVRARQFPHELSGGMQQRVLIAIAWALDPEIVIADEPTSALDVTIQQRVLERLDGLRRERGTSIILVTHDLGVAADRADHIVVMQHGHIVEQGPAATLASHAQHPYTRALLAAVPNVAAGRLAPHREQIELAPIALTPRSGAGSEPLPRLLVGPKLEVNAARKEYVRFRPDTGAETFVAVDDVSLAVGRGKTYGLVGESGSGKSTLARIIARLTEADAGEIRIDGERIDTLAGRDLRALRRRIQYVYQSPYRSVDGSNTVEQIVTEPLRAFGEGTKRTRRIAATELLDRVGLPAAALVRHADELSGGQRQRIAIARALALQPEVLVLDEPVSALDVSVQAQIMQLLVDLQAEQGLTYFFISHDLGVVRQIAHTVGVMRSGRLLEEGEADRVFAHPAHPYTQQLLEAIPGRALAEPAFDYAELTAM